jgi:hypothetical protein
MQNVQAGASFPHVGDGLMQAACGHSFWRRFAFSVGDTGELIQAGSALL